MNELFETLKWTHFKRMKQVLAKLLENRLEEIIRKVATDSQSTFIKDRQILD